MGSDIISTNIPSEFNSFKYVMLIAETKSKKLPIILIEIDKLSHQIVNINGDTWYIVGFRDNADDFFKLASLVDLTSSLTNVVLFRNGIRIKTREYGFAKVLECAMRANQCKNTSIYCNNYITIEKETFRALGLTIVLGQKKEPKIKKIEHAKVVNPCSLVSIGYSLKPYEIENHLERFNALVAKENIIIFDCPFFKIENFSCNFIEEYIYE
jgi:hypothetical protein